jgi:hypothetical protein
LASTCFHESPLRRFIIALPDCRPQYFERALSRNAIEGVPEFAHLTAEVSLTNGLVTDGRGQLLGMENFLRIGNTFTDEPKLRHDPRREVLRDPLLEPVTESLPDLRVG